MHEDKGFVVLKSAVESSSKLGLQARGGTHDVTTLSQTFTK